MSFLGSSILFLTLVAAIYQVVMTALAYRWDGERRRHALDSAFNAGCGVWGLLTLASLALMYQFVTDDFSNNYVMNHSALAQPKLYKISAFWGGQEGSLLMWAWVLATYGLVVALTGRRARLEIAPTTTAIIGAVNIFFVGMIAIAANPFATVVGKVPSDGMGLTPLLQNYWMQIHPPTLYAGYVGCTIPFAFAVAGLLHHRFDAEWVTVVRRWALFTWLVLTIGVIMGGAWAYETLGWGGYWAWDPVENASFLPWLTSTAFIHSIMLQGRRGMLKNWNMILVSLTFLLSIFGTFLTRSGVVNSVHAFAQSSIGGYFAGFLAIAFIGTLGLLWYRRDELNSGATIESLLSREGAFLLGNWLLLGAMFAVLWGTVYPTISKDLFNTPQTVDQAYFNRVMAPIGLLLLFLAGVGPLLPWRRVTVKGAWRAIQRPLLLSLIAAPLLWVVSHWSVPAAAAFTLCIFVLLAVGYEIWRGVKARRSLHGEAMGESLLNLFRRNRRRYGGYTVHLGVALMAVGLTGSNVFKQELEPLDLKPGETMMIGDYKLTFVQFVRANPLSPEKMDDIAAEMKVERGGEPVRRGGQDVALYPNIDTYKPVSAAAAAALANQEPESARRPAILSTPANDLYLALIGYDLETQTATIKAYFNPLVMWIWVSTLFFIGGTLISMWPGGKRQMVAVAETAAPAAQPAPAASRSRDNTARPVPTAAVAVSRRATRSPRS